MKVTLTPAGLDRPSILAAAARDPTEPAVTIRLGSEPPSYYESDDVEEFANQLLVLVKAIRGKAN